MSKVFLDALDLCGCYNVVESPAVTEEWRKLIKLYSQLLETPQQPFVNILDLVGAIPGCCYDFCDAVPPTTPGAMSSSSNGDNKTNAVDGAGSPTVGSNTTLKRKESTKHVARTISASLKKKKKSENISDLQLATAGGETPSQSGADLSQPTAVVPADVEGEDEPNQATQLQQLRAITFADWAKWVGSLRCDVEGKYLMSVCFKVCAAAHAALEQSAHGTPQGGSPFAPAVVAFLSEKSVEGVPASTLRTVQAMLQLVLEDKVGGGRSSVMSAATNTTTTRKNTHHDQGPLSFPPWFYMLNFGAHRAHTQQQQAEVEDKPGQGGQALVGLSNLKKTGSTRGRPKRNNNSNAAESKSDTAAAEKLAKANAVARQQEHLQASRLLIDHTTNAPMFSADVLLESDDIHGQTDDWASCKVVSVVMIGGNDGKCKTQPFASAHADGGRSPGGSPVTTTGAASYPTPAQLLSHHSDDATTPAQQRLKREEDLAQEGSAVATAGGSSAEQKNNVLGLHVHYLDEYLENRTTRSIPLAGGSTSSNPDGGNDTSSAAPSSKQIRCTLWDPYRTATHHRAAGGGGGGGGSAAGSPTAARLFSTNEAQPKQASSIEGTSPTTAAATTDDVPNNNANLPVGMIRFTHASSSTTTTTDSAKTGGTFANELSYARYYLFMACRMFERYQRLRCGGSHCATATENTLNKAQLLALHSLSLCACLPQGSDLKHSGPEHLSGEACQFILDCAVKPIAASLSECSSPEAMFGKRLSQRMKIAGFALATVAPAMNAIPLLFSFLVSIAQFSKSQSAGTGTGKKGSGKTGKSGKVVGGCDPNEVVLMLLSLVDKCILQHPTTPSRLPGPCWELLDKLKTEIGIIKDSSNNNGGSCGTGGEGRGRLKIGGGNSRSRSNTAVAPAAAASKGGKGGKVSPLPDSNDEDLQPQPGRTTRSKGTLAVAAVPAKGGGGGAPDNGAFEPDEHTRSLEDAMRLGGRKVKRDDNDTPPAESTANLDELVKKRTRKAPPASVRGTPPPPPVSLDDAVMRLWTFLEKNGSRTLTAADNGTDSSTGTAARVARNKDDTNATLVDELWDGSQNTAWPPRRRE